MLDKKTQARLEELIAKRRYTLTKGIYITHRYVNDWAHRKWKEDGWDDIRPEHLRLISIISMEALNINELSQRARVSKQAMSKMVATLIDKGFISYETDPKDSRSKIISITKEGVDFMFYFISCSEIIKADFETIIGAKKTAQLISILTELSEGILEKERALWQSK